MNMKLHKLKVIVTIVGILLVAASAFAVTQWGWTNKWTSITHVYYEADRIVVNLDQNVHECGWNNTVHISASECGTTAFNTNNMASLVMASILSAKKVMFGINKCVSDRACASGMRVR